MIKKIFNIIRIAIKTVAIVTVLFFVSFVLLQRLSKNNASLFGYRMFAVVTGSMEPVYNIGDVLLCKSVDTNTLKEGDDVTYLGKESSFAGKVITHRIIKIDEKDGKRIFHTKGVASNSEDPVIEGSQIYGIVSRKMAILSFFHKYSSGSTGFFLFIVIPIMLLVGTEIVQTMLEKYEKKNNIQKKEDHQSVHEQIIETQKEIEQEKQQNNFKPLDIPDTIQTQQNYNEQMPTEEQLQQQLQQLQQQVAAQQQIQTQPTEEQLQQELQALQQQVAQQENVQQPQQNVNQNQQINQ